MRGKVYLTNAFSLSMVNPPEKIIVYEEKPENIKQMIQNGFESAVGHESTAKLLSQLLSVNVPVNRQEIKLKYGDKLIVFQLMQRLSEGKILDEEELKKIGYRFLIVEIVYGEVM